MKTKSAELAQEKLQEALVVIEQAMKEGPRYAQWYEEAKMLILAADSELSFPLHD